MYWNRITSYHKNSGLVACVPAPIEQCAACNCGLWPECLIYPYPPDSEKTFAHNGFVGAREDFGATLWSDYLKRLS